LTNTFNGGVTMRSLRPIQILAGMILWTACDTTLSPRPARDDVQFRTDTTLAAYVGEPVTWADSNIFPIAIDPLVDVGEPPLRGARIRYDQRVMRFTWVRSFHPTIIVRVVDLGTTCRIVTTVAHPHAIYFADIPVLDSSFTITGPPPKPRLAQVTRRDSTDVTPAVCADLGALLPRAGLVARPAAQLGGPDGAEWLLERADAEGHVSRMTWSPNSTSSRAVWNAGMAFLTAGRALPVNAREIY
jgi:hypothetical protein